MVRLSRCQFWDCTAASDWHEAKTGGRREEDDGDQSQSTTHPRHYNGYCILMYIVELCIHACMHMYVYIYIYTLYMCVCAAGRDGEREKERERDMRDIEREREKNKRNCTWLVRAIYLYTYVPTCAKHLERGQQSVNTPDVAL